MAYYRARHITAEEILKLETKTFTKEKLFKRNHLRLKISWYDSRNDEYVKANFELFNNEIEKYLIYEVESELETRINLITVKSNLGFGNIYYFECPYTKRKCRVLYYVSNHKRFVSRYALNKRLYYRIQTLSKIDKYHERKRKIEKELERLENSRMKTHYKDRITKTMRKYKRLCDKSNKNVHSMYILMNNSIMKLRKYLR